MTQPVAGGEVAGHPDRRGEQADRELGPRATVLERVETKSIEGGGVGGELGEPFVPGGLRVGLVEAHDVPDLAPETLVALLRLELRVGDARPVARRARDDAPVRRALVDHAHGLLQPGELIAAEPLAVEIVERVGRDDAPEADPGAAATRRFEQPRREPRRDVVQRLGDIPLDPGALHPGIEVRDVDVRRAPKVRRPRNRRRQSLLPDHCVHEDELPRLHVRPVHRELGQGVEALVHGRRS